MHPFLVSQPSPLPDRRHGPSELEVAFSTLSHAVEYLITEQLAGLRPDLRSNREAVAILCDLSRFLLTAEKRVEHRGKVASWLRKRDLVRYHREDREVA